MALAAIATNGLAVLRAVPTIFHIGHAIFDGISKAISEAKMSQRIDNDKFTGLTTALNNINYIVSDGTTEPTSVSRPTSAGGLERYARDVVDVQEKYHKWCCEALKAKSLLSGFAQDGPAESKSKDLGYDVATPGRVSQAIASNPEADGLVEKVNLWGDRLVSRGLLPSLVESRAIVQNPRARSHEDEDSVEDFVKRLRSYGPVAEVLNDYISGQLRAVEIDDVSRVFASNDAFYRSSVVTTPFTGVNPQGGSMTQTVASGGYSEWQTGGVWVSLDNQERSVKDWFGANDFMPIYRLRGDFWRLNEQPINLTEASNPYPTVGTMMHRVNFTVTTTGSVDGGFKWGIGARETGSVDLDALVMVGTFHRTLSTGSSTSTLIVDIPAKYASTDLSIRLYSPESEAAVLTILNGGGGVILTAVTVETRLAPNASPLIKPEYLWYREKKVQHEVGLDSKFLAFVARLDSAYIGHPFEVSTIFANELGPNWARFKSEAIGVAIQSARFRGVFDTYSKSLKLVSGLETVRADDGTDLDYTLDLFPYVERYLDRNSHDWTTPFASYSLATGHTPLPATKILQICQLLDNIIEKELEAILEEKDVSDVVISQ
jgi:hypothetical protein